MFDECIEVERHTCPCNGCEGEAIKSMKDLWECDLCEWWAPDIGGDGDE